MTTRLQATSERLAALCFNVADRILDVGLYTFTRTGSITMWDMAVVRAAYGLIVLGNRLKRVAG